MTPIIGAWFFLGWLVGTASFALVVLAWFWRPRTSDRSRLRRERNEALRRARGLEVELARLRRGARGLNPNP